MANPNPTTEVFPQIDARLDVDGSTWNLNAITNESVALVAIAAASGTSYKIGYLAERPAQLNFASSNAAPAISGYTLVTTVAAVDSASKFYVDYDRAFIITASSVSGPVAVTYSGMGSVVRSREINNVHFGHNYIGPKSSAPALDNEGNALAAGDQYYNTSENKMYIRTTANEWKDLSTVASGNTITSTDGSNLTLTTVADGENVVINSTAGTSGNTIVLPKVRATTNNYVLAMSDKTTGATEWQATTVSPTITGVSGELNTYETPYSITGNTTSGSNSISSVSSVSNLVAGQIITGAGIPVDTVIKTASGSTITLKHKTTGADVNATATASSVALKVQKLPGEEPGGTLTLTGTEFGIEASIINSIKIMKSDGTNAVSASSFGTPTGTGIPNIVFNGSETNYNTFPADTTWYIEVTKSALTSNKFSSGKSFTKDPTISAITQSVASADYNSGFTGTSGHFGSYGGQGAGGGKDSNTKLLLNFDRGGGTDIEDSSNMGGVGHEITATNNAVIKASPFGDGKSAFFFDGSNDKLTIPTSSDFQFGSSNSFTVEFWVRPEGTISTAEVICSLNNSGSTDSDFYCRLESGKINWYNSGDHASPSTSDFVSGTWYHVAFVRKSGTMYCYKNGKLLYSFSDSYNYDGNGEWGIGARKSGGSWTQFGEMYLDEFRIVKGTDATDGAVYSSDFTVPTSRLTAITNTKLLIHSNVNSVNTHKFTRTNVTENETGLVFNGSDAKLGTNITSGNTSSYDLDWTNDVTIEMWLRVGTGATNDAIWETGTIAGSTSKGLSLATSSSSGALKMVGSNGGSAWNVAHDVAAGTIAVNNTWTYLLVRKYEESGTHKFQTKIATTTAGGDVAVTTTSGDFGAIANSDFGDSLTFGYWTLINSYMDMDVKHIRVSKVDRTLSGQDRYSSTSANLTIPAYDADVASDSNTVLLYNQPKFVDSATSGTTHAITTTDAGHSENHGGIASAMAFSASGKAHGSAGIYFDGVSDNLKIFNTPHVSTNVHTIDFWLWYSGTQNGTSESVTLNSVTKTVQSVILDLRKNNNGNSSIWIYVDDSNQIGVAKATEDYFLPSASASALTVDTWQHICVVRKSGNAWELYIDGVRKLSATYSVDLSQNSGETTDGSTYFWLGGKWDTGTSELTGYIDSFRYIFSDETASGGSLYHEYSTHITPPTQIYGAYGAENPSIGSIEITTATEDDVNVTYSLANEDNASVLGSSSDLAIASDSTGANKKKGTLTGTLQGTAGSVTNLRIQAKANNDANRLVEVNETSGVGAVSFTKVSSGRSVLFNARRYVGSDLARDINGLGFKPDFVWFKERNTTNYHQLFDSVRGGDKALYSNASSAQNDRSGNANNGQITGFNNDGFSLSTDTQDNGVNQAGQPTIAWAWKAGGAPSGTLGTIDTTTTSGAGTISSSSDSGYSLIARATSITQSVNRNSGFSITQFTGHASGVEFPHNLGGTPEFFIVKKTSDSGAWATYHKDLTSIDNYLILDDNTPEGTMSTGVGFIAPTNALIKLGTDGAWGGSTNTYICYAWKSVNGVSEFGSYDVSETDEGNKSTTVTLSDNTLTPKFIIIKTYNRTSAGTAANGSWYMFDTYRGFGSDNSGTGSAGFLKADDTTVEATPSSDQNYIYDVTAGSFKVRGDVVGLNHQNSSKMIYMAFA